jgi:hypothetical protein
MSLLVMGNGKVSKEVALFDLPPKLTCLNNEKCWHYCYAYSIEAVYPWVAFYRKEKLKETMMGSFVQRMITELQVKKVKYCRPHSAGDFYSQEYVNKWVRIVKARPQTQFFTFTKAMKILDFSELKALPNFNLMSSVLSDGEMNFDLPILVQMLSNKYDLPICPNSKPYKKGLCMGECKLCLTAKGVLFNFHGRYTNRTYDQETQFEKYMKGVKNGYRDSLF